MSEIATVGHFHRGGTEGGATFWLVRLPDGYLVDCGFGYGAEDRAVKLAAVINLTDWSAVPLSPIEMPF